MRTAILNSLGASPLVHFRLRTLLFKLLGIRVALRCRIAPRVFIRSQFLTLGEGSSVNTATVIDNHGAPVTIGRNVGIAVGVRLLTASHDVSDPARRAGAGVSSPIVIEDGAWIGSGAIILGGVTVGAGAIVAAGAVVTANCAPNTVYAGVPAKAVKTL